jgi:hypothetical protein
MLTRFRVNNFRSLLNTEFHSERAEPAHRTEQRG